MDNTTTMANTFRAHHDSDNKCLSITNQNQMGSIFPWMTDDHLANSDGDILQGTPPWPHIHTRPMDVYNDWCPMEILFDTLAPKMQILPQNTWHSHPWTQTEEHDVTGQEVFQTTIGNTHPMTNILLHQQSLNTMMQWTQQHLDAYLATVEVLCEWNVEPRWTLAALILFPMLHLCMGCGVGVISYDKISLVINKWL